MLKAKDKLIIALSILGTVLLVITLACSIVFAAFSANKQATTTIKFHEGVEIAVSGIDSNGKWIYNTDGSNTFATTAPTTAAIDGLALSPIKVSVSKGASKSIPVHVRIFAVVTTNSTGTLPELKLGTGLKESTNITGETAFLNSITTPKKSIVGTCSFTTNSATPTTEILQKYILFTAGGAENAFHGSEFKAYVRIYASTTNGEWGESYTFSF